VEREKTLFAICYPLLDAIRILDRFQRSKRRIGSNADLRVYDALAFLMQYIRIDLFSRDLASSIVSRAFRPAISNASFSLIASDAFRFNGINLLIFVKKHALL